MVGLLQFLTNNPPRFGGATPVLEMTNHPNSASLATGAPFITPATVSTARGKVGHTQAQAAMIVYRTLRSWQQWEGGERRVDPAAFELYLIKTGQWSESKLYAESGYD